MSRLFIQSMLVLTSLTLVSAGLADPPDHAPAHGYRSKQQGHAHRETRPSGGFEVVFDAERGISVAVGFPDVYFHADRFYRQHNGQWQVSTRADVGWGSVKIDATPDTVRKAHVRRGKAKRK